MNTVTVDAGDQSYPVYVGHGLIDSAADLAMRHLKPTAAAVLTHPRLAEPYAAPIVAAFAAAGVPAHLITTPAGERFKRLSTTARLYDRLATAGLDRKSVIVTVGGGVIGDVGGFVAATYLRGIAFVQVPTTVLAQVDASIGGKTGVDLALGKNLVGAFHQPRAVITDVDTLATLPVREFRSGLAEVVKHGIISDAALFRLVASSAKGLLRRERALLEPLILRNCEIKAAVVSQDPMECGIRATLNFGHTVGHALEAHTRYRRFKHGEAVAIGMVSACLIGEAVGVTPASVTEAAVDVLRRVGLPVGFPEDVTPDDVISLLGHDKKAVSGVPRFVLVRRIGEVMLRDDVPCCAVRDALLRQQGLAR